MTIIFSKVRLETIEQGLALQCINKSLDETVTELFKLARENNISAKKLKGNIIVKLTIQPISDSDEHFNITSKVKRQMPEIINNTMAVAKDGELFIQGKGSTNDSPLQLRIDTFSEDTAQEGDFIQDDKGNKIATNKKQPDFVINKEGDLVNTATGEIYSKKQA